MQYVINLVCTNVAPTGPSVAMDLPGFRKGLNANYISAQVQVFYMTHGCNMVTLKDGCSKRWWQHGYSKDGGNMVTLKDHNINYNMIGDISNDLYIFLDNAM